MTRKILALAATLLVATGCGGTKGDTGAVGAKGDPGATSTTPGPKGDTGDAGTSCTVAANGNGSSTITCTDGTTATVLAGQAGNDGASCTVKDNGNGTKTVTCGIASVVISNGTNGGDLKVTDFHGTTHLQSTGEFDPAAANPKVFVKAAITGASISNGVVTVDFTVKDSKDAPLTTLSGVGGASLAKLVPAPVNTNTASKWVAYVYRLQTIAAPGAAPKDWPNPAGTAAFQPYRDSGGTFTNLGNGAYRYVFKSNLLTMPVAAGSAIGSPATRVPYEPTLTHRVSIMMGGHSGPTADASFDFVPAGGALPETRNIVATATCKNCHGSEFHGHGGDRLSVENCVTCHTAGAIDPNGGESIDMKVMIHRIHGGKELPSVIGGKPYVIWGNSDSKADFSDVGFPAVLANCKACHAGTVSDVANWQSKPTIAACTSCHDDVNFATGANHAGGPQVDDQGCKFCHPATGPKSQFNAPIDWAHDWTTKDLRNQPEFGIDLSINTPPRGYFIAGEAPVVTVKLSDLENPGAPIDHTLLTKALSAQGCQLSPGTCPARDGALSSSNLYVSGPRSNRQPVLTTAARAAVTSSAGPTWNISAAGATLALVVDQGRNVMAVDGTGADYSMSATISVPVSSGTFVDKTIATAAEIAAWLNADVNFSRRAKALVENGKVVLKSRNLGPVHAIQLQASAVGTAVFAGDVAVHIPTGTSTVGNSLVAGTDPKAVKAPDQITYTLDDVEDLQAGTYVLDLEIADRGRVSDTDYRTPSVKKITFQVKTATVDKPPAGNCNSCHQNQVDGLGFVQDYPRHGKRYDYNAVDMCGSCHDYQPTAVTGTTFPGALPISKRVHAVHDGANLTYPVTTVGHADTEPGRNWNIGFPQDIRNCETCHDSGTSGSWKTAVSRLACAGCHDTDAATAHINLNTYDPTPTNPWSGDEVESCKTCH